MPDIGPYDDDDLFSPPGDEEYEPVIPKRGQPTELRSLATDKTLRVRLFRVLSLGRLGVLVFLRDETAALGSKTDPDPAA